MSNKSFAEKRARSFIGFTFGRLTIQDFSGFNNRNDAMVACLCLCGTIKDCRVAQILKGRTLSCGCLRTDRSAEAKTIHGLASHPLYNIYSGMVYRCTNPLAPEFKLYGGRGINVCSRWLESIHYFIEDMGPRPSQKHSLDRVDVNKGYEPSNCRWATFIEQQNNKQYHSYCKIKGVQYTAAQAARVFKVNPRTMHQRISRGECENCLTRKAKRGGIPHICTHIKREAA